MCGRFYTDEEREDMRRLAQSIANPSYAKHLTWGEIRPSEFTTIIISDAGKAKSVAAIWGYPNENGQTTYINARAETVSLRRSFGEDMAERRCVIPVSGFFEWAPRPTSEKCLFFDTEGGLLYIAGIWRKDNHGIYRFVVLTTEANASVSAVHSRMPLLVSAAFARTWLSSKQDATAHLTAKMPLLPYLCLAPEWVN